MKQTCHLATAGPDANKKSDMMMKTATAGIDDGSGGLDNNDSSDLRLSGASATTTF